MERKGFCFYKNFWETAQLLNQKQRLVWYEGIMRYVFEQEEPNFQEGALKIAWAAVSPILNKGNISAINGINGGKLKELRKDLKPQDTPSDPQDITQDTPSAPQDITNERATKKKLKNNLYNTYVNNIFNKNVIESSIARARAYSHEERGELLEQFKQFISSAPPSYTEDILEIVDTMLEALEQSKTVSGLCFGQRVYYEEQLKKRFSQLSSDDFREVFKSVHFGDPKRIAKKPFYILGAIFNRIDAIIEEENRRNK